MSESGSLGGYRVHNRTVLAVWSGVLVLACPASAQSGDLLGGLRALRDSVRQLKQLVVPAAAATVAVGPATAGAPADAAAAGTGPASGDSMLPVTGPTVVVASLELAGVRLGMSPTEARAAMARNGFQPTAVDFDQLSWEGVVAERVATRLGQTAKRTMVPHFTVGLGPDQQRIEVTYTSMRGGAVTTSVHYTMSLDRLASKAFRERLIGKYGPPSQVGYGQTMLWCSPGERQCRPYLNREQAFLNGDPGSAINSLQLDEGSRFSAAYAADLAAEVERRAPKTAPTNF